MTTIEYEKNDLSERTLELLHRDVGILLKANPPPVYVLWHEDSPENQIGY